MFGVSKKVILVETGECYEEYDTPTISTSIYESLTELATKLATDEPRVQAVF